MAMKALAGGIEKADATVKPAGLGARDTLRMEAGMPLYGHELTEDISPVQGGQAWALKLNKPDFIGKEALAEQVASDTYARIAGLVMSGRAPAREGYKVYLGDREVGEIRSGSMAPAVDNKNIATALVVPEAATIGTTLEVEIRGTRHEATVVALPFYKRAK